MARGSRARQQSAVVDELRSRILAQAAAGLVAVGDRLPSARALAAELNVNQRRVLSAYAQLEEEGLVERHERSGVFLGAAAPLPDGQRGALDEWLVELLAQALARGIRVRDVAPQVHAAVESVPVRAACLECNMDDLHALCTELAEDYGFHTTPVELHDAIAGRASFSDAHLIISTEHHERAAHRVGARRGLRCITVGINPELRRRLRGLLQSGPLYFVAEDPRFAAKVRRFYQGQVPAQNLRFILLGRDDPASVPAGASAFVTARARTHFVPPPVWQLVQARRVFSPDSARTLLRHLLAANRARVAAH